MSTARLLACTLILQPLAACGDAECGPGETPTSTGECADLPEGLSFPEEDLAHMPDCSLATPSDRLDVSAACADDICAGMSLTEIEEITGEAGDCKAEEGFLYCRFQNEEIRVLFDDDDNDGAPDPGSVADGIFLHDGWDGANSQGLALQISMRCWLDHYGYTEDVERWETDDGEERIWWLYYPEHGLFLHDLYDAEGWIGPDGVTDWIALFGAR